MEEGTVMNRGSDELMELPPGFRFHPMDEEIITCYLTQKVMNSSFIAIAIGEADLNKSEPWDLPEKAKMGENEWYFFCQRDRKYPTGMRTNRATESGYWKATGKDKEIFNNKGKNGCLIGMKKTLVFYRGRAPKGEKTNWVMHEYRLEGKISQYSNLSRAAKDEWVVCRVFHKNMGLKKRATPIRISSFGDHHDLLDCSSLPPLMDPTNIKPSSGYGDYGDYYFKPAGTNYNSAAAAPPLSAPKLISSSPDHGTISTNNYHNYFSNGGLKPNHHKFQVPLQPTGNYNSYPTTTPNMAAMLYPQQQQQQQQQQHQFHQNPSHHFSLQKNPNNSDYCFQQGMMHMRDASSSIFQNSSNQAAAGSGFQTSRNQASAAHHGDDDDDDQIFLRAIAAASNINNNDMNRSNHDTSSSAGGLGLEGQCKVEQFSSNQSMFSISQDTTGISTDLNTTEISSSLVAKQELGSTNNSSYQHDDDQDPSVVPISGIDGLWDF